MCANANRQQKGPQTAAKTREQTLALTQTQSGLAYRSLRYSPTPSMHDVRYWNDQAVLAQKGKHDDVTNVLVRARARVHGSQKSFAWHTTQYKAGSLPDAQIPGGHDGPLSLVAFEIKTHNVPLMQRQELRSNLRALHGGRRRHGARVERQ